MRNGGLRSSLAGLVRTSLGNLPVADSGRLPVRLRRSLQGLAMGLGAPAGWLLVRYYEGAGPLMELKTNPGLYIYMSLGSMSAFLLFGVFAGDKEATLSDANRALSRMAVTDELTGLRNVRYFWTRLPEAFEEARRSGRNVGLIVLDLDHFKMVNDDYGHQVGDEVLHEFGKRLQASVRSSDTAARVGGEEFAVLLPGAGIDAVVEVAERIRASVEASPLAVSSGGQPVAITVSAGAVSVESSQWGPQKAYSLGDAALYRAKAAGRNRVVAHSDAGKTES